MTADLASIWSSLHTQLDAHRPRSHVGGAHKGAGDLSVPVTVLTGFLGAGKSTILAALLSEPGGMAIRAIVNDVGALPFDPTLIVDSDDVRVELSNGCACCEQTTTMADALDDLAATPPPDLIVVEASGVADPLALAQVIEANPSLHLDRIVAVVDVVAFETQLEHPTLRPIIERQLDAAHCVAVASADRVDPAELTRVIDLVEALAPGRVIMASGRSDPAIGLITSMSPRGARPTPIDHALSHPLFTTTVSQHVELSVAMVETALADSRPGLLRAKGRLMLEGSHHLVQLTPSVLDVTPTTPGVCGLTLISVADTDSRLVADLLQRGSSDAESRSALSPASSVGEIQ